MKLNNTVLFKYLCLDLGMKYIPNQLDIPQLGSLKDRFLQLAEEGFPEHDTKTWIENFSQIVEFEGLTAPSLGYPEVFKKVYQCLCWSLKIRKPHTKQQEAQYIERFLSTEGITKAWRVDRSNPTTRLARYLIRRTMAGLDLRAKEIAHRLRDGPGACFDGEIADDKHHVCYPSKQLLRYASYDLFFANEEYWVNAVKDEAYFERSATSFDRREEIPDGFGPYVARYADASPRKDFVEARLTLVPKTYKGPRGVFISPKEAMKWQLAIDETLKEHVAKTWLRECYDPSDQRPSGDMAQESSYTGWFGTLDLSDASDRVPLSLVAHLFHRQDYLALACTRPSYAWLPDGSRHRLGMFSPMGDGKTFPVLTIICATLAVSAILDAQGYVAARPPSIEIVEGIARSIRVFGDDIIVPSQYFDAVVRCLEIHNLKVNVSKSFVRGRFREACGVDAYKGVMVTPLRQKGDLPEDRVTGFSTQNIESCERMLGLIALHNHARMAGLTRTAFALFEYITRSTNNRVGLTSDYTKVANCLYVPRQKHLGICSQCPYPLLDSQNRFVLVEKPRCLNAMDEYGKLMPKAKGLDMLRCIWCGTSGLISRLDSLRIPVKYDTLNQRIVQRVLAPDTIKYVSNEDPRWDLNHAMFPKQQSHSDAFRKGTVRTGSPVSQELWERACKEMKLEGHAKSGGGLRLQWVPVI